MSSTALVSLNPADDGAKEPIPKVSKKLAKKPMIHVAIKFLGCNPRFHSSSPLRPISGSFSGLARSSLVFLAIRITFKRIPITQSAFKMYIAIKHPSRLI